MKKKIGRNDLCTCGSGLKYKKCCLLQLKGNIGDLRIDANIHPVSIYPFSSSFKLIPSTVYKDCRIRFFCNKVYLHPVNETFHTFLLNLIQMTFGDDWFQIQKGMHYDDQHILFRWLEETYEFRRNFKSSFSEEITPYGKVSFCEVDGPQQSLLSLGWDLYCLQVKNKLPFEIVKKLQKNKDFQSFRYEIAIAAMMVRAGYHIDWSNNSEEGVKKCEFLATHLLTGDKVTVEAKSLMRDGVLNQKGFLDISDDKVKQIVQRLRDAEKKKEEGIPHAIFIDLNRPPQASDEISDYEYLKKLINQMQRISEEKPAKHEVLVLTNFSPYYGEIGEVLPKYQHFPIIPEYCKDQKESSFYAEMFKSLDNYGYIPEEV